jgi:ABC-type sugar transport system ATPase subunit
MALLTAHKVRHNFGGLRAIDDFDLELHPGELMALIGPNGAGKTTVFNCITGFYKPTEGRIALQYGNTSVWDELGALTDRGERSVTRGDGVLFLLERMPDYLVTQKARVARTFQNIRLFQGMTVLENLLVAQHNRLMRASGFTLLGALGLPSYAQAERAATTDTFIGWKTEDRKLLTNILWQGTGISLSALPPGQTSVSNRIVEPPPRVANTDIFAGSNSKGMVEAILPTEVASEIWTGR